MDVDLLDTTGFVFYSEPENTGTVVFDCDQDVSWESEHQTEV